MTARELLDSTTLDTNVVIQNKKGTVVFDSETATYRDYRIVRNKEIDIIGIHNGLKDSSKKGKAIIAFLADEK